MPINQENQIITTKVNSLGLTLGQKMSSYFLPTVKEEPAEAEIISHKLMIRSGMIRRLAAGIYSYLPLGLRTLQKVEKIIRTEMNRFGAQETLLPAVQPGELWKESGRWGLYGPELTRFKDRHDRDCVIGPTHEEVMTDLIRREIKSFRDLPLNLYQIQTKFRDEIRPRFGLMRGREFIMKDAYSFDVDEAGADLSYKAMYSAYVNIFTNCGLKFAVVEADSGPIGGSFSHEFMVLAESGEDTLAFCDSCSYAANLEKAELKDYPLTPVSDGELTKTRTPGCRHVNQLAAFLKTSQSSIIKSMLFTVEGDEPVLVLIPGHREINQVKLKNVLGGKSPSLAQPEEAQRILGMPMGFVTPVGAKVKILADFGIERLSSGVVGAGEEDYHLVGAKAGRDFKVDAYFDLAEVVEGDKCPRCSSPITIKKGIEVGHVFKLGLKYSESMKAYFAKADGAEAPIVMGCYGIGVGRTAAASVEQNHDADGIVWPMAIAPFEVHILPLQTQTPKVMEASIELYDRLLDLGVETLLDDRDERPGLKFKDADLIGIPIRVTVSEKSLLKGQIELKRRDTREMTMLDVEKSVEYILSLRNVLLTSAPKIASQVK
jgi:prolyl-tRNA synthetase